MSNLFHIPPNQLPILVIKTKESYGALGLDNKSFINLLAPSTLGIGAVGRTHKIIRIEDIIWNRLTSKSLYVIDIIRTLRFRGC